VIEKKETQMYPPTKQLETRFREALESLELTDDREAHEDDCAEEALPRR
jgi:hypothetical protein